MAAVSPKVTNERNETSSNPDSSTGNMSTSNSSNPNTSNPPTSNNVTNGTRTDSTSTDPGTVMNGETGEPVNMVRSITLTSFGGIRNVKVQPRPESALGENEVTIKVKSW